MTTTPRPRPTSSPTSSRRRDDLPQVTSSLVPLPTGGRGHWSRHDEPHDTSSTSSQGRGQTDLDQHRNKHLLLAAQTAKITGDPEGTMAVLLGCPNCHPRDAR